LLQDVFQRVAGEARSLVVASEIAVNKPPEFDSFLHCIEDEGYFQSLEDDNGARQLRPMTLYLGVGQAINQISIAQAQSWYQTFSPYVGPVARRRNDFLGYFGRFLVTGLFLERRLTALAQTNQIDFQSQPPQHDLHALYLDDQAR